MNDAGQVAGYAYPTSYQDPAVAFRYTDGEGVVDLGSGSANGIKSGGDVVGSFHTTADGGQRGFIYMDGFGRVKLDDLVELSADDALLWACLNVVPRKINASGVIFGFASDGSSNYAPFLLTPHPAP